MEQNPNQKSLYAEAIREIGVLILVFGPLQLLFETDASGLQLYVGMLFWLLLGGIVLWFGVQMELWRKNG